MKHILKSLTYGKQLNIRLIRQLCGCPLKKYNENNYDKNQSFWNKHTNKILLGTSLTTLLMYKAFDYKKRLVYAEESTNVEVVDAGGIRDNLPYYSLKEVAQHSSKDKGIWVIYGQGVYDITDFVIGHPGGDQILLAAGNSIEPFWALYGIHHNPHVYNILESLRIGNLTKEEAAQLKNDVADPYSTEPKRHPALIAAAQKPFNAEVPPQLLIQSFITPNELFYVRNHFPVPEIDPETFTLEIEIEGSNRVLSFTLDDLKKMPQHTITATLMCAGNRRSEMIKVKPVKGLSWGPCAIGNATWTGVKLRELLKLAGVGEEDDGKFKHVQFEGVDLDTTGKNFGASIPFWRAVDRKCDVIVAYEMNGVPLPRDHGFPLRVIVPGIVGARNVKWLERIVVSEHEADTHWQQLDYKGFSPSIDYDNVNFPDAPAIQELPVISAICIPSTDETIKVEDEHILVKGYAWSGGGQKIVRVDVTVDEGDSWHVATLDTQDSAEPPQHWSWTLWTAKIPVRKGVEQVEIWAKAVDTCYNTQPESVKHIWNFRGVLSNAYHRVPVKLQWPK